MSDIVVEKRRSTPKIEFEERRRILFHIESIQGLSQHGWQPIASISVSVENLETKDTVNTECKKSGPLILWGENMPIQDLKDSSKVRFDVKSKNLWNKTVLGRTDTFDIRQLMQMQSEVGEERDSFVDLIVNMNPSVSSEKAHNTILSLSIREMAAPNRNVVLMADDVRRLVDESQQECFKELRSLSDTINVLRTTTFVEETSLLCLLDMLLGAVNGVRKIIADPDTRNTNKLTVACCKALNGAFLPYQTLSARKLGKKGERHTAIVKDMLCGAIRALEAIERALRISTSYHYEKHHLEQKQIAWTRYFEFCGQFLLQGGVDQKIESPVNTTVRRTQCPYQMTANNDLPMNSKVLPMDLPVTYTSGTYDRPDLVRLIGEWIFSPSFSNSSAFDLNQKPHNVFCLSGPAGCGKTQLASPMIDWLREMKCLGGYFSFDRVTGQTPRQLLDALPITLIHQAGTVQPDIAQRISRSYSSNLEAAHTTLEDFFDRFFAEPVLKFEEERGNRGWRLWNPVDQLVFVIDGLGSQTRSSASRFHGGVTSGPEQAEQEEARMLQDFVNFFTSNAIVKLPSYFKFLILCRSSTSIHKVFKEKGIGYVHEMTPIVQYVESQSSFTSSSKSGYGSLSTSSSGSGIGSSAPSISIQAF